MTPIRKPTKYAAMPNTNPHIEPLSRPPQSPSTHESVLPGLPGEASDHSQEQEWRHKTDKITAIQTLLSILTQGPIYALAIVYMIIQAIQENDSEVPFLDNQIIFSVLTILLPIFSLILIYQSMRRNQRITLQDIDSNEATPPIEIRDLALGGLNDLINTAPQLNAIGHLIHPKSSGYANIRSSYWPSIKGYGRSFLLAMLPTPTIVSYFTLARPNIANFQYWLAGGLNISLGLVNALNHRAKVQLFKSINKATELAFNNEMIKQQAAELVTEYINSNPKTNYFKLGLSVLTSSIFGATLTLSASLPFLENIGNPELEFYLKCIIMPALGAVFGAYNGYRTEKIRRIEYNILMISMQKINEHYKPPRTPCINPIPSLIEAMWASYTMTSADSFSGTLEIENYSDIRWKLMIGSFGLVYVLAFMDDYVNQPQKQVIKQLFQELMTEQSFPWVASHRTSIRSTPADAQSIVVMDSRPPEIAELQVPLLVPSPLRQPMQSRREAPPSNALALSDISTRIQELTRHFTDTASPN